MKDFNNFLQTLSSKEIQSIKDEVLSNREAKSATLAIADISFEISLKLLEKYHLWLQE